MSIPNLVNNIIQPQNIVINQVPLSHAIMTNVNASNGIPLASALTRTPNAVNHSGDLKTGLVLETIPIAGASLIGVQSVPIQGISPIKTVQTAADSMQLLSKPRLGDLIRDIDTTLNLEDEVEEVLLGYIDEFIDRVLNGACQIAKHRHVNTIEVKDIQLFLNRNYNIWVPGLGTDELRPYRRRLITESHKHRLALIREALKKY